MNLSFYVTDRFGNRVPVQIRQAQTRDYLRTKKDSWQTDWTSKYIQQRQFRKFAMETLKSGTLLGLLACEPLAEDNCLRLVYMETEPCSNPTLVKRENRKYNGVGRAFMAKSVAYAQSLGMDGTLSFKAKTTELFDHYRSVYGAIPLPYGDYELILFPENGIMILNDYMEVINNDDR